MVTNEVSQIKEQVWYTGMDKVPIIIQENTLFLEDHGQWNLLQFVSLTLS